MRIKRIHGVIYTAVAVLLLFAQTALAVHDVHHHAHETTELCTLFASSDHGKAITRESVSLCLVQFQDLEFTELSSQSFNQTIFTAGSRGPPSSQTVIA